MKPLKGKKCKHCRELFTPYSSLQKYCTKSECIKIFVQEVKEKEWKKRKKELIANNYDKEHKLTLQKEINKLARMIDEHCGYTTCIDCGKTLLGIKQIDGSHRHNVQGNENIRYNLLNIHSARSECNKHYGGRKETYITGLIERYGPEVEQEINNLSLKYKEMHFSNKEIYEAIAVVRKLQRNLYTYENKNGYQLRNIFNSIIGLY